MKWLFTVCLALFAACAGSPQPTELPPFVKSAIAVAKGVGDAVLRQKGAAELKRSVPELVPLIDVDPADEQITLAEVESFLRSAAENPEQVALLVATLFLLRQ
jgi:hypothetical protein